MKLSEFIIEIRKTIIDNLANKNFEQKDDIIELYNESINKVLLDLIGDSIEIDKDDGSFSWIYESERETKEEKSKRIVNNIKDKIVNRRKPAEDNVKNSSKGDPITDKQQWTINKIETTLSELDIKFTGETKQDASSFISQYIGKSVEDVIPKGVL